MPQQERNPKQAAISLAAPLEQIEKNLTAEEQFKKMESAAPVPALNLGQLGALASAAVTPLYQGKTSSTLPVPTMAPLGTGTGGFKATVPPSPAHKGSTAFLGAGSHQEMVLPLSEAAPELFGGNPAAATPHYDAIGAAPPSASSAIPYLVPRPQLPNAAGATPLGGYAAATPQLTAGQPWAQPNVTFGAPTANAGGFKSTVPPSPAHAASTTFLGAGGHQEMVLPLSEAAPELFGGNPAAATPHYDAVGAAGTAAPAAASFPTMGASAPAAPFMGNAAAMPIVTPAYSATPGGARSALPPFAPSPAAGFTPRGAAAAGVSGFKATVPPSPAHQASTAYLSSGSHQEMVLPLSEAAPELFGGNPAAATPHYDAVGAATGAYAGASGYAGFNAPAMTAGPAPIPFAPGISTITPMAPVTRNLPFGGAANFAPSPAIRGGGGAATPSGFKATVPSSPAHQASTAYLSSGSHQEMFLPLSEAAPELFGGNPAASTPHYDAIGAATGDANFAPPARLPAGPAPIPLAPGISTVTPMARNPAGAASARIPEWNGS